MVWYLLRIPRPGESVRPLTVFCGILSSSLLRCTCLSTIISLPWYLSARLRVVYAHPQTHEQCSEYLEKWGGPVIHTSSNASSALEAKKTPNAGAILSVTAASIYKMPVIMKNIENNPSNTTRFVRISRAPLPAEGAQKCSIIIDPSTDRTGLLHDLLEVFAQRRINLTRIESRPSKRGMGNYVFFLDYEWSPQTNQALEELKSLTNVKELGCYKKTGVPA